MIDILNLDSELEIVCKALLLDPAICPRSEVNTNQPFCGFTYGERPQVCEDKPLIYAYLNNVNTRRDSGAACGYNLDVTMLFGFLVPCSSAKSIQTKIKESFSKVHFAFGQQPGRIGYTTIPSNYAEKISQTPFSIYDLGIFEPIVESRTNFRTVKLNKEALNGEILVTLPLYIAEN